MLSTISTWMSSARTELFPAFAAAAWVTIQISFLAAMVGAVGGFVFNAVRMRFPRAFAAPYKAYVFVIRGTPYLSQLVIFYFGLPVLGLTMTAVQASIVSLSLYATAYFAEIFRAGWLNIPKGHIEAARAFGIGRSQAFRVIELPQVMAFVSPLLANQVILVIKESAVTSIITVPELTMTASNVVATTYTYIGPYAMLILCYWILTQSVAFAATRITAAIPFLQKTS